MDFLVFGLFLGACACAATTGAMFPTGPWYDRLAKPAWTPPNWVFPVAWTSLYLLMAFAGARVVAVSADAPGAATLALAFWALQIAANTLWTPIFFGLRRIRAALPVMGVLWLAVLGCLLTHWRVDLWAGLAFVPYLVWVTVAAALNLTVVRLNPDVTPIDTSRL
jgi:tryptophan-rich sensory protein